MNLVLRRLSGYSILWRLCHLLTAELLIVVLASEDKIHFCTCRLRHICYLAKEKQIPLRPIFNKDSVTRNDGQVITIYVHENVTEERMKG